MRLLIGLFLFTLSTAFSLNDDFPKGSIAIELRGIQELSGEIGILVFDQANGFPSGEEKAILRKVVAVNASEMLIELDELPYGEYAIALVHDVNANQKLDKNFLGVPSEPFGFSKVEKVYFGPPKFEEAKIKLSSKQQTIAINLLAVF
ncbi:MAG: DUF2141 domain-containing protein [Vicingaceae bacterium]